MLLRFGSVVMLALLALPAAPVTAAKAASFDCDAASTAFEKAICASTDLSEKDETLAVAYQTAIGGLSSKAAARMKADQKAWLDFAQRACSDDAKPQKKAYDEDGVTCLGTLFDARVEALEESRMIGGLRFYQTARFAAFPDPEGTDWSKVAQKQLTVARIDGDAPVARGFNRFVDGLTESFAEGFDNGQHEEESGTDASLRVAVETVSGSRVTVALYDYSYGHGAAHGNYGVTYAHYLRDAKRPLEASDIFAGKGWEERLAEQAFDALKAELGEFVQAESASDIVEAVADPARWTFDSRALTIIFQPYEVASYADGTPEVRIPWSVLQDDLAGEAWTITSN